MPLTPAERRKIKEECRNFSVCDNLNCPTCRSFKQGVEWALQVIAKTSTTPKKRKSK